MEKDNELTEWMKADVLLQSLIKEKKLPGLAITVARRGHIAFQKGYGHSDLDKKIPVDAQKTIFRIASVSKPIAATALAQMVADEQIDLDTSFYDYVPYYPKKKYDFTLRQLAGHTAGIRAYKGKEYALNKPYSIKDSIRIFKDDALLFKPGTDYHYNSYDWVLVSLAMQEVSGVPFEDYVQQKVLQPLDMKNTYPEILGLSNPNITNFYSKNRLGFRKAVPVSNFHKLAGGGYLSTSGDIAKLGRAYLDKKILNDSVLTEFLTSETINDSPTYYGLGWQVSMDKKGRRYYGHVGNGVGGYSNFFIYPEQQMVISILINCTNPNVQDELDDVINVLL
ncbi:MAG: serine hydrolase domain-containing protein [Saonia sp.]